MVPNPGNTNPSNSNSNMQRITRNTPQATPATLFRYAQQLLLTKVDLFSLPPSGDLYAYPSVFPEADQAAFVANTEEDARILGTSVSSAWEWAGRWGHAIRDYFPKFGARGIVSSLVGVNVPYNIPTLAFGDAMYKVPLTQHPNWNKQL